MVGILLIVIKLREVLKFCHDQRQRKYLFEEEIEYLYLSMNHDGAISPLK